MKHLLAVLLATSGAAKNEFTNEVVVEFGTEDYDIEDFAQRHELTFVGTILGRFHRFKHKRLRRRSTEPHSFDFDLSEVAWSEQQVPKKRQKRDYTPPDDPMWKDMWYLNPDYSDKNGPRSGKETRHMNVTFAWDKGYSGKGVVVSILDDGIEMKHPDLEANYDKDASLDVNGNDDDPTPHYNSRNDRLLGMDSNKLYKLDAPGAANAFGNKQLSPPLTEQLTGYTKEINRHGTRCAGEVAASKDNSVCVPGVAFNAKVGGVRMLDGDVTDAVEAASIGHNQHHVDIYSASWGPDDDGRTVDGPAKLAIEAFAKGAKEGRGGKGNIFVWASGNGGRYDDNCNCDGYTNSIYTVSISSTTQTEQIPWYSEQCVSTLATTYSSGTSDEKKILSTDLRGLCTENHTGTSASAPIAAGILALVLEANEELTWRDVQQLIINTSKKHELVTRAPDQWRQNGVGRWFSARYGYGLMDAGALVVEAEEWKAANRHLPEQLVFNRLVIGENGATTGADTTNKDKNEVVVTFNIDKFKEGQEIERLEHVTCVISAKVNGKRGNVSFFIQSPSGTKSMILSKRSRDTTSQRGFTKYEFLTVELWDEPAAGEWKLYANSPDRAPELTYFELIVRGTKKDETTKSSTVATTHDTEAYSEVVAETVARTVTTSGASSTQQVTEIIKETTQRVNSKIGGQEQHAKKKGDSMSHTDLFQLVAALLVGGAVFYALCSWYLGKSKSTAKYTRVPTVMMRDSQR